jgi:hypothetical protein
MDDGTFVQWMTCSADDGTFVQDVLRQFHEKGSLEFPPGGNNGFPFISVQRKFGVPKNHPGFFERLPGDQRDHFPPLLQINLIRLLAGEEQREDQNMLK